MLVLLLVFGTALIWHFVETAEARPVRGTISDRIGSYTGAGSGQGHNIKASLDLVHTDLDVGLEDFEDVLAVLGLGTGEVVYLDAFAGGTNDGSTWANACPTLNDAIDEVVNDAGYLILVASGHTETLGSGADGADVDKADIVIYGLGVGKNRPKFDYDTATDEFVIGADDIHLYNLWFHANVTAVNHAIDVETGAKNSVIENCLFTVETPGTDEFIDTIIFRGTASDGGRIVNCIFDSGAITNSDAQSAINFIDADYLHLIGNHFL